MAALKDKRAVKPRQATATATARERRAALLRNTRRELLVEAAKSVFAAVGLEAASMRMIAAEAGCSTGAIYPYFNGKEELYAAVLSRSLESLQEKVDREISQSDPGSAGEAGLRAFFKYYQENPDDLSLGLYLFGGMQPTGLNAKLNRSLNKQLRGVFDQIEAAFIQAGKHDADKRTASGIAQATGLLILEQTGRLRLFEKDASLLFSDYLTLS